MGSADTKATKRASLAFSDDQVREALYEVFRFFGADTGTVAGKQDIANRLSKIANHEPAWTYLYVHNFLYHNLQAGRRFKEAIIQLAQHADGAPILLVQSRAVSVRALGDLKPGTLVRGDSRQCANPVCTWWFLPRVHNQKYCSLDCSPRKRKR